MLFAFPCFLGDSPNKVLSFTHRTQCLFYLLWPILQTPKTARGVTKLHQQAMAVFKLISFHCRKSLSLQPHWLPFCSKLAFLLKGCC